MHVHALDITVRTREINVFHRAHRMTLILRITAASDTMMVNGNDFARFNIPDELGADGTERTSLAADHVTVPELAERQRTETIFVTACINPLLRHDDKGECALDHVQCLHNRINARHFPLIRILLDKMRQDFTVRSGLEKASAVLQVSAQLVGIHKVTIMGQCEITGIMSEHERLHILDATAAGRGITHMTDGHISFKRGKVVIVENLRHQAQALDAAKLFIFIDSNDSAAFLTPVLEGMQAVICDFRSIRYTPNAEYAAFLMKSVESLMVHIIAIHLFVF